MVIKLEIGKSAGLLSKSVAPILLTVGVRKGLAPYRLGYDRVSTTERMSVGNDSLANLNLLKIQSGLLGNFKGYPEHTCTSES